MSQSNNECITVFEFGYVSSDADHANKKNSVPRRVFEWLEDECARNNRDSEEPPWLRTIYKEGKRAVQFTNFVGVVREPKTGFQIEILPKTGKIGGSEEDARKLLIGMLQCLYNFRHIPLQNAGLHVAKMPLVEIFIRSFLEATDSVVKRGLRRDYVAEQDNVFALRGKLLMAQHLRENLIRKDRFFTEHDELTPNRSENRLLHTALKRVSAIARSSDNQRLARELRFVFDEVPESVDIAQDIKRIRVDRGMNYYEPALAWAKLLLNYLSPTATTGQQNAPSLLFPMNALFEACVEKHLPSQLKPEYSLKRQPSSEYLVEHRQRKMFRLKPDLLIQNGSTTCVVLDAKWKLIDQGKLDNKYDLSQSDFYQLFAYGKYYLNQGADTVVLIYPRTDKFSLPLDVFAYTVDLKLWVLPFCCVCKQLLLPQSCDDLASHFVASNDANCTCALGRSY